MKRRSSDETRRPVFIVVAAIVISSLIVVFLYDPSRVQTSPDRVSVAADRDGPRSATIRGSVFDCYGRAMPSTKVHLEGRRVREETETDKRGVFVFRKIRPGHYHLRATSEVWGTAQQAVETADNAPVDVIFAGTAKVLGTIVGADESVSRRLAFFRLMDESARDKTLTLRSGPVRLEVDDHEDVRFLLDKLGPGRFTLELLVQESMLRQSFEIKRNDTTVHVVFDAKNAEARPPCIVRGRAFLGTPKTPIANDRLRFTLIYPHGAGIKVTTGTTSNGTYEFSTQFLEPGTVIKVAYPECNEIHDTIEEPTLDYTKDLLFTPLLRKRIGIVANESDGTPIGNANALIDAGSELTRLERRTDANGEFSLDGLTLGMHEVRFVCSAYGGGSVVTKPIEFRISEGEDEYVFELQFPGTVVTVAVQEEGAPIQRPQNIFLWVKASDAAKDALWSFHDVTNNPESYVSLVGVPEYERLEVLSIVTLIRRGVRLYGRATLSIDNDAEKDTIVLNVVREESFPVTIVAQDGASVTDAFATSYPTLDVHAAQVWDDHGDPRPERFLDGADVLWPVASMPGAYSLRIFPEMTEHVVILSRAGGAYLDAGDIESVKEAGVIQLGFEGFLTGRISFVGGSPEELSLRVTTEGNQSVEAKPDSEGYYCVFVGDKRLKTTEIALGGKILLQREPTKGVFEYLEVAR